MPDGNVVLQPGEKEPDFFMLKKFAKRYIKEVDMESAGVDYL